MTNKETLALKAENKHLRNLLGKIHSATRHFYPKPKKQPPAVDHCPYGEIVFLYHKELRDLPKIRALGDKRQRAMRARWLSELPSLVDWENYFKDVAKKPFLTGDNARGWKADIDFLLRQDILIKMQEGKYDG